MLASSIAFACAPRVPRLSVLASVGVVSAALMLEAWLPFRENALVHLALDLSAGFGFVGCFAWLASRVGNRVNLALTALGLSLLLLAPLTLRASMITRGLLYDMSSHARVFAMHTGPWLSPKRVKSQALGAVWCKPRSTRSQARCTGFVTPEPTKLAASASGADVLMLTLDAVRHDQVDAFPALLAEMGPYVRFTRAVSPASRTVQSSTAMLRGRPLRQSQHSARSARQGQSRELSNTLAASLTEQGYRAVTVTTHRMLRQSREVAQGFEYLAPTSEYRPLRGSGERVPFPVAAAPVLTAARDTPLPMLVWLHALETHAPYQHDLGVGPLTKQGQLTAARDLDRKLSAFVRDFKAARPGRKLVVVVFSDHGEEFGEHGGSFHSSTVYAEQARVMMALSAPGLNSKVIAAPVSTTAVPATLLDLLGLKTPCSFTVPSLLACIERGAACPSLAVSELVPFKSNPRTLVGYTSAQHRVLYDRSHDVLRVFDSAQDATEQYDLAGSHPELLRRLKREARAWDQAYCVERLTVDDES